MLLTLNPIRGTIIVTNYLFVIACNNFEENSFEAQFSFKEIKEVLYLRVNYLIILFKNKMGRHKSKGNFSSVGEKMHLSLNTLVMK